MAPSGSGGDLAAAERAAREVFGIERLRPEQRTAIESVLAGRDTLAMLPTGYGKSLIYQVPAVLADRPTIVVSPLIALMADQEQALQRRGVPVVRIDSTLRVTERRAALERLAAGGRLVVLTTPETLESQAARGAFASAGPALLCVDEAHCISEWGHDFRPAYLRLGTERGALGDPPVLALTATATPRVRQDVAARLALRDPAVVVAPPHRPNLALAVDVVPGDAKQRRAGVLLRRLERPGILYCATTVAANRVWSALDVAHIPSARYHGRMTKGEREEAQERFMRPRGRLVMVATSAFGMGIDKPDIRYVVHYQAPGSLEQYVQEAGRAGRDGRPSRCILLYDPADLDIQRALQSKGRAGPRQLLAVAGALRAWGEEHRAVNVRDLALSANVPQTVCRAMCAHLEQLEAVELDDERRYHVVVSPAVLLRRAKELAGRLEIQRRADEEHLEALDAYAHTTECRSVFIRRHFGEDDPPECGQCDRCAPEQRVPDDAGPDVRAAPGRRGRRGQRDRRAQRDQRRQRARGGEQRRRKRKGAAAGQHGRTGDEPQHRRRKSKRRRGRKGKGGGAGQGEQARGATAPDAGAGAATAPASPTAAQPGAPGEPSRRRRKRRKKRRRPGGGASGGAEGGAARGGHAASDAGVTSSTTGGGADGRAGARSSRRRRRRRGRRRGGPSTV